ncbi:efflux RND transporter permease subunit [Paracoccus siganidrum]|uniref:efflux RND transporter permease subunit n=1 Tax=Paracoccus siganidrum TaxID=1276757 RepID=UPI001F0B726F|nr:efflux RND transporter permease subunit [Paracoccus siganidrum]
MCATAPRRWKGVFLPRSTSRSSSASVAETRVIRDGQTALAIDIMFLFLNSWRSTVITALTLPIATTATIVAVFLPVALMSGVGAVLLSVRHDRIGGDHDLCSSASRWTRCCQTSGMTRIPSPARNGASSEVWFSVSIRVHGLGLQARHHMGAAASADHAVGDDPDLRRPPGHGVDGRNQVRRPR